MLARDLVKLFRSQAQDEVADFLWSNNELLGYIDDAQRKACRKTRGIADATTTAVCQIRVVSGRPYAALHPSINQIRWARKVSDNRPLEILNIGGNAPISDDYGNSFTADAYGRTGEVCAMVLGEDDGHIRWLATPMADDVVNMAVFRGPLNSITSLDDELELSERFETALLKWVLHRAYAKRDLETYNEEVSQQYLGEFLSECTEIRREQERLVHRPRLVAYGGL